MQILWEMWAYEAGPLVGIANNAALIGSVAEAANSSCVNYF
jgi:hypothetical protein